MSLISVLGIEWDQRGLNSLGVSAWSKIWAMSISSCKSICGHYEGRYKCSSLFKIVALISGIFSVFLNVPHLAKLKVCKSYALSSFLNYEFCLS